MKKIRLFLSIPNKWELIKTLFAISPFVIMDLIKGEEVKIAINWNKKNTNSILERHLKGKKGKRK